MDVNLRSLREKFEEDFGYVLIEPADMGMIEVKCRFPQGHVDYGINDSWSVDGDDVSFVPDSVEIRANTVSFWFTVE